MKCLSKKLFKVYYIENAKIKNGVHSGLSGDVSGLWGNVRGLSGDCDLITKEERDNDNNILAYIKE